MSHPHPELTTPAPLTPGGLRVIPLGGLGEVGRNMTVFEHEGRLLIVDCGVLFPEENHPGVDLILPDFAPIRDRLDQVEALVLTHGHEDHIGATPYLLRERGDIPLVGSELTLALLGSKLREHRLRETVHHRVREGDRISFGPFELEFVAVNHSIPDALAVAIRAGGPAGAAHRRLQDGPAAARRPGHRPARLRPARGGGGRPLPHRLHQRRGAGLHHPRAGDRPGPRPGLPRQREADHRRLLRLPRAPGPAGARRRGGARPEGRLRRPVDGAQHADRPGPGLPDRAARRAGRRQGAGRAAAGAPGADLHRFPGRAAVGAEPDRPAQPQLRPHRRRATPSCSPPR